MTQPGSLGGVAPRGDDYIARRLRELEQQIAELRSARVGNAMTIDGAPGLKVKGGGSIRVEGGGDIILDGGDLTVDDGVVKSGNFVHGSTGWRLKQDGNVEFNDVTLRGGIIGNDALTNPVAPAAAHQDNSNYALTTTQVAQATIVVPVPAGFSQALVWASSTTVGINPTASADYLNLFTNIAGSTSGWVVYGQASALGGLANVTHSATAVLTGLASSFSIEALVNTQIAPWPSNVSNIVNLDAIALFLR